MTYLIFLAGKIIKCKTDIISFIENVTPLSVREKIFLKYKFFRDAFTFCKN